MTARRSLKAGSDARRIAPGPDHWSYKHGLYDTQIYRVWKAMIARCKYPSQVAYKYYGALGVSVCERWMKLENFIADMGEIPQGMTLDRIDPRGNYEPGNCRWATRLAQANNRRTSRFVLVDGQRKTLGEWSAISGVRLGRIRGRLIAGWAPELAVFAPSGSIVRRAAAAKLTYTQAERIRVMYASGRYTKAALAKEFGVSGNSVGRILSGDQYKSPLSVVGPPSCTDRLHR